MSAPMSATNPFLNFPYGSIQMECEAHDLIVDDFDAMPGSRGTV